MGDFTRNGLLKRYRFIETYAIQFKAEGKLDELAELTALLQIKLDTWGEPFIGTGSTDNLDTRMQQVGKELLDNIKMETREDYNSFKELVNFVTAL